MAAAVLGNEELERASSADGTMTQKGLLAATKGLERLESSGRILFRYPWEMLEANEEALTSAVPKRGRKKLGVSPEADVEEFVTFDPSGGPILVGGQGPGRVLLPDLRTMLHRTEDRRALRSRPGWHHDRRGLQDRW